MNGEGERPPPRSRGRLGWGLATRRQRGLLPCFLAACALRPLAAQEPTPAAPVIAVPPAPDPARLYADLLLLRRLVGLGLDQEQARGLLRAMASMQAHLVTERGIESHYQTAAGDALLLWESALLRGEPADSKTRSLLLTAAERYRRERAALEPLLSAAVGEAEAVLDEAQRAKIETDEAAAARQAREEAARRARDAATQLAVSDLSEWVRSSDEKGYRQDRSERTLAVVKLARKDLEAAPQSDLAAWVAEVYDHARRMSPAQFNAEQTALRARLRALLTTPPGAGNGCLMTRREWVDTLRDARTSELLGALLEKLPRGAVPARVHAVAPLSGEPLLTVPRTLEAGPGGDQGMYLGVVDATLRVAEEAAPEPVLARDWDGAAPPLDGPLEPEEIGLVWAEPAPTPRPEPGGQP